MATPGLADTPPVEVEHRLVSALPSRDPSSLMNPAGVKGPFDGVESKLGLLVDRIDRIQDNLRRYQTGHYIRAYVPLDIANPAPLGFMAFGLTTCLYMTSQAGLTEASTQFLSFPLGITFGGLTMLVVAILEIFRRNTLGATAFGTFGAFWLAVGVYGIIRTAGIFFLDSPKGQETITSLFGVAAIGFMCVSVVINAALPLVFLMIGIMFFLLAAGTTRPDVAKAAGWWGIFTSALAFYIGMAMLFEEMWGREVLPLFYTKVYKRHAKMLFPRVSEHDPLSISAGVPYEGRPELRHGDNVSAMGPTPSLLSLKRWRGGGNGSGTTKHPAEMV
ncbi:hypothetical protein D9Q98_008846 [Chlorella vulgaris]|uniref:Uncharacterized protein n=1 Tax=Chlorella vulgaris TaxID=3077 RepID=A0A9D4YUA0_CHLVU|nr:hypothetical protein D9Q98_008846 [Chlorella vulgaris]